MYLAAILSGGWLVARKGFYALRNRTLDINVLMTLAVIGAAVIGEWLEGATVIFLFSLANLLESYSMNRARRSIKSLMDLTPNVARVTGGGGRRRPLPVEEIQVGEILAVRPGERIPLDGTVVEGSSEVDQSPITGESLPVSKAAGDEVFGGTINAGGLPGDPGDQARPGHDPVPDHPQRGGSPLPQGSVPEFRRSFCPLLHPGGGAGRRPDGCAAAADRRWRAWGVWFYRALVLLVVACPCALVISTPVTIVSALARATRDGILFKGGVFLEAVGSLKAFAFDKTGTLTQGKLVGQFDHRPERIG